MRSHEPYWKETHKCYYLKFNGKHQRLDRDLKKSRQMAKELIAASGVPDTDALTSLTATAEEIIMAFLEWSEKNQKPTTLASYKRHLCGPKGFCPTLGPKLRVRDMKPYHLDNWLDNRYPRNKNKPSVRHGAYVAAMRPFNWAAKKKYIPANPLVGAECPKNVSRGQRAYLEPEQWPIVLEMAHKTERPQEVESLLDYLIVMKETGCRPQELRMVEARHLDHKRQTWVFPPEEAKGGEDWRIIKLGDVAYGICQRLALKHPTGPLFRNRDGRPWIPSTVNSRFRRLSQKCGFSLFPYMLRHSFATDGALAGVDMLTMARNLGHKGLKMLMEVYAHVERNADHMEEARRRAAAFRPDLPRTAEGGPDVAKFRVVGDDELRSA